MTSTPRAQAGNVRERRAQKAPPGWSLEMGMAPTPSCPSCPLPAPLAAQSPTRTARSSACAPWPLWGSGRSQGSASHPARGKHIPHCVTSLHGLPRGPAAAPRPFPLCSLCLFSFPPCPPQEPPPSCPTDAPQMGARQAAWAQPLPAPGFLQPPPATRAFRKGSFQRVSAVLTP